MANLELVGVEGRNVKGGRSEDDFRKIVASKRYCSEIEPYPGQRPEKIEQIPNGAAIGTYMVRKPRPGTTDDMTIIRERATRLGYDLKGEAAKVQYEEKVHGDLSIVMPGEITFENAVSTFLSLQNCVRDFVVLTYALNLFSAFEFDKLEAEAKKRDERQEYLAAVELYAPTMRYSEVQNQRNPKLVIKLWSLNSVKDFVDERIIAPIRNAFSSAEDHGAYSRIVEDLKGAGVSVDIDEQPKDTKLRRSHLERKPLYGGDESVWSTSEITLSFPKSRLYDIYLNEFERSSRGYRRKDVTSQHFEDARTLELKRAAGIFLGVHNPGVSDREIADFAAELHQHREDIPKFLSDCKTEGRSPEFLAALEDIKDYYSINTVFKRTTFSRDKDKAREQLEAYEQQI